MKEVVKVSISGIAFTFDEDAFRLMEDYLKKLNSGYAKHPDGREIIADIEARIAELILEHQESDRVVSRALAAEIIGKMGIPEDMDEGVETPVEEFPRRLYRNPDGAKLAGICSGLGTYFNVDPTWIRLGLFAPLLAGIVFSMFQLNGMSGFFMSMFAFIIVLYFVLWIAVPMARSPRQKLEMRGEKITASSIEQNFREEAAAVSGGSPRSERTATVWADIMYILGRIVQIFLKVVVGFIAFGFAMAGIGILVAIVGLISGASWIALEGIRIGELSGMVGITPVAYAIIMLTLVLIPIFVLVYFLLKVIFSGRTNRPLLVTLWVVWFVLLIYAVIITVANADYLRREMYNDIKHLKEHVEIRTYPEGVALSHARHRLSGVDIRDGVICVTGARDARITRKDGGPVIVTYDSGRKETRIFELGQPEDYLWPEVDE